MAPAKRTRPLILGVAVNGAEYSARKYAFIPVTPEQAVNDAVKAYELGARYSHFHAREPRSGDQFVHPGWFDAVSQSMAERVPDMATSYASSRKGLVGNQIQSAIAAAKLLTPHLAVDRLADFELLRAIGMDSKPDLMTAFTALETKLNGTNEEDVKEAARSYEGSMIKGYTDPPVISAYYRKVLALYAARQIVPEYELTTMSALWTMETLLRRKWFHQRPHFVFLFGFSARLPIDRFVFELCMAFVRYLRTAYAIRPAVTVGAVIHPHSSSTVRRQINEPRQPEKHDYLELLEWVLEDDTVDALRVGLEDTPVHFGEEVHNADLVALVRGECDRVGVRIEEDPSVVHDIFGTRR